MRHGAASAGPSWLLRGCFGVAAVPVVLVALWLAKARTQTRDELDAISGRRERASLSGVAGPVRVRGTLEAKAPRRAASGVDAVIVRTTVKRLERGGGVRLCQSLADEPTIRLPSGETAAVRELLDGQLDIDGHRLSTQAGRPLVRVLSDSLHDKMLDGEPSCPPPPTLGGRVMETEIAVPVHQEATIFACARDGVIAPCGDGQDAIVLGPNVAPLSRHLKRDAEEHVISAMIHLVLLTILGVAASLAIPSRQRQGLRIEVVKR